MKFANELSKATNVPLGYATETHSVLTHLMNNWGSIVLWGPEEEKKAIATAQILIQHSTPSKVFLLTDTPLSVGSYLFKFPAFGHHFLRRYEDPAAIIYHRVVAASLNPHPFGLANYFPSESVIQKIRLVKSGHKQKAVAAMETFLSKQGLRGRIAALAAQALDELLMNAIFDAPKKGEEFFRHRVKRNAEFDLADREQIDIHVGSCDQYMGISVGDQFGTLKKKVILDLLQQDYSSEAFKASIKGASIGIHGIVRSGMSMLFVTQPGVRTEAMFFFPKADSYKAFREGFRFLGILAE